jgi:site-specific DNA-cytosine methylase
LIGAVGLAVVHSSGWIYYIFAGCAWCAFVAYEELVHKQKAARTAARQEANRVEQIEDFQSALIAAAQELHDNGIGPITSGTLWCVPLRRFATVKEYLKIQGFPISQSKFKIVVSDNQIKRQMGNTMSVNVLKAVFKELL